MGSIQRSNRLNEYTILILVPCDPMAEVTNKLKAKFPRIARGEHVQSEDLIGALERGLIRGAAIDVTSPEPLSKRCPLWKAPNLLLTPLVSLVLCHY